MKDKKIILFIISITVAIYYRAIFNGFVNWDDGVYVYNNPFIRAVNIKFFKWAFLHSYAANWHPLTWLTHAIDYKIWGINPVGHHLMNVVLHVINSVLVFFIVKWIMSKHYNGNNEKERFHIFVPLLVAILFAIHPLHVESVAWISERKDVLCGFFYLLAVKFYMDYIESRSKVIYFSVFLFSLLALMSKAMAITLPLVFLLIDWFVFSRQDIKKVFVEKIPFFFLSMIAALIAIATQQSGGALAGLNEVALSYRLIVPLRGYGFYIIKTLFPVKLIPLYPYPSDISIANSEIAIYIFVFVLSALIVFIVAMYNKQKLIGAFLYYLITLLPVIGFVQVGGQSVADRYMYLPSIGLFLLLSLFIVYILKYDKIIITATIAITVVCAVSSYKQIGFWKNGATLWAREITVMPSYSPGYTYLAEYYLNENKFDRAAMFVEKAMQIPPYTPEPLFIRGQIFFKLGMYKKALSDLTESIRISLYEDSRFFLTRADVFLKMGMPDKALSDLEKAISLDSYNPEFYYKKAIILRQLDRFDDAKKAIQKAIEIIPLPPESYIRLLEDLNRLT